MVEVYHLFFQAVLPTLTFPNKFLQREDPCIEAAHGQLNEFVRRLLGKFVQIDKIKAAKTVDKVNFEEESQQLKDGQLFIGFATRQLLKKLVDEGYTDERNRDQFYQAVRHFYQRIALEAISKLPLQDDTLIHARFVDFFQRENASIEDEEFFLRNYPTVLPTTARETYLLQEEFVEYQLLSNEDIPKKVWDEAQIKLSNEENEEKSSSSFRMDVIWGYLSSLKLGNGRHNFSGIKDVAKTVLILPHSNASEERVFSLIRKNKTAFWPSLQVDGTLASVLTIKMANKESSFEPPADLLSSAKKATWNYNKEHLTRGSE